MKFTYEEKWEREARHREFRKYCSLYSLNYGEVQIARDAWNAAVELCANHVRDKEGTTLGIEIIYRAL